MATIECKGVTIVLNDEERATLRKAFHILHDLWSADTVENDGAQGKYTSVKNPSYNDNNPSEYNGKIDAYDAAEVIEHILDTVNGWDEEDIGDED